MRFALEASGATIAFLELYNQAFHSNDFARGASIRDFCLIVCYFALRVVNIVRVSSPRNSPEKMSSHRSVTPNIPKNSFKNYHYTCSVADYTNPCKNCKPMKWSLCISSHIHGKHVISESRIHIAKNVIARIS